ncbi:hypothetical protein DSO57_1012097 [Entomophthora muscae]|uniref:Uncharacterized protein n=1 Tax=Entomophthora muscae TaxID=34485 RepID=A0ACC2SIY0_9FUNG|nr:hypothetical protein DSO57_1012097 [Entomophthora muscae]
MTPATSPSLINEHSVVDNPPKDQTVMLDNTNNSSLSTNQMPINWMPKHSTQISREENEDAPAGVEYQAPGGYPEALTTTVRNAFASFPDNINRILVDPVSEDLSPNLGFSSGPKKELLACNTCSKLPFSSLVSSQEACPLPNTGIKPSPLRSLFYCLGNVNTLTLNLPLNSLKFSSPSQSEFTPAAGPLKSIIKPGNSFKEQEQGSVVVLINQNNRASPSGGLLNHQKLPQAGTSQTAGPSQASPAKFSLPNIIPNSP